jgi:integrase
MDDASRVRFTGPLESYAAELARLGYTPLSALMQLRLAAQLSRYLVSAGLPALTEDAAADFLAARRAAGRREYVHMQAFGPLLGYRALLHLAVTTGLRASELTGLNCADVHLGTGSYVACRGKGRYLDVSVMPMMHVQGGLARKFPVARSA